MKFFRRKKPTLGSDKNGGLVLTDYEPLTITITHVLNAKCGLGWTSNSYTGLPVPVFALGVGQADCSPPLLYYHAVYFACAVIFIDSFYKYFETVFFRSLKTSAIIFRS